MEQNIVTQRSLVVYYGISYLTLVFSWYTHEPLEEKQVTRVIFHGIPLESVVKQVHITQMRTEGLK